MTILIIIVSLPLFTFPAMLSACPADAQATRTLVWIYPFYMLLSAWLAWKAYPQRAYVSWLLIIIMLLTTAAMYVLVGA